jgi:pilus assembly protein CpaC
MEKRRVAVNGAVSVDFSDDCASGCVVGAGGDARVVRVVTDRWIATKNRVKSKVSKADHPTAGVDETFRIVPTWAANAMAMTSKTIGGLSRLAGLWLGLALAPGEAEAYQTSFPPMTAPGPAPEALALPDVPGRPTSATRSFLGGSEANDGDFELTIGQARILTTREPIGANTTIAAGDPGVIDFTLVNARQIRIIGLRSGISDLSISLPDADPNKPWKTYTYLINVVPDLSMLKGRLASLFPDASVKLTQIRQNIVVEGQARDTIQVSRILEVVRAYADTLPTLSGGGGGGPIGGVPGGGGAVDPNMMPAGGQAPAGQPGGPQTLSTPASPAQGPVVPAPNTYAPGASAFFSPDAPQAAQFNPAAQAATTGPQVINLLKVPGPQQVLLKVRVAELNRTSFRQIGADSYGLVPEFGAIFGTRIASAGIAAPSTIGSQTLQGAAKATQAFTTTATTALGNQNTAFAIFQNANFELLFDALRQNNIVKILAEPNLIAMNGHQANFLAGGQFPVPVSQASSGVGTTVSVSFKQYGVLLGFIPFIHDGDVVRLTVDPEVSSIDPSTAVTLFPGGTPIPGLASRNFHTTVELREGQTLAIAGLLQLTLNGSTSRIPGLGDLPVLGPFFSNTTHQRQEKELVVLVTPYLVDAMNPDQVPPGPGDEVKAPNDVEFFVLNRIEGRTGRDFRATTEYDDPFRLIRKHLSVEKRYVRGPVGFSD